MLLADVVTTSAEVGAQSSRLAKVTRIAHLLSEAARDSDTRGIAVIVSWLSGELPQRQIGVGWAALRSLPPPGAVPVLTVVDVDAAFTEIGATAGRGFAGAPRRVGRRSVRRRHRGRADVSAAAAGRRTATGRAGRCDGRCGGQGGRNRRADGPAGGDAPRRFTGRRRRGVDPRRRRPRRFHAAGRTAGGSDARADRHRRGRCTRKARRHSDFRGQAGWRPGADPPQRQRRDGLHPQPRRRHRPAARSGRGDAAPCPYTT